MRVDFEAACRAAERAAAVLMCIHQRGSASMAAASHGARHACCHFNRQMAVPQHMNQSLHVPMELGMVHASQYMSFK